MCLHVHHMLLIFPGFAVTLDKIRPDQQPVLGDHQVMPASQQHYTI